MQEELHIKLHYINSATHQYIWHHSIAYTNRLIGSHYGSNGFWLYLYILSAHDGAQVSLKITFACCKSGKNALLSGTYPKTIKLRAVAVIGLVDCLVVIQHSTKHGLVKKKEVKAVNRARVP